MEDGTIIEKKKFTLFRSGNKVLKYPNDLSRTNMKLELTIQDKASKVVTEVGIPQVLGYASKLGGILMEYVDGEPLSDLIVNKTVKMDEVIEIQTKIRKALEQLHGAGFAHGDILPCNVLYKPETKQIHMIDFEQATWFEHDQSDWERCVRTDKKLLNWWLDWYRDYLEI
jgi:tRNA A-37 threonylcarbamoyl transferase component Bud32